MKSDPFLIFDFHETFICYRGVLKLNCYIGKSAEKFPYGFKNLVKLGVWKKSEVLYEKLKIVLPMRILKKKISTPNFTKFLNP